METNRDFAIEARGTERVFHGRGKNVHALGPIDLSVRHGEFICIVGPSGCGKTTLLRIIGGLTSPSSGTVNVLERSNRPDAAVVFQEHSIFPWKTVCANIRLGLELDGLPKREATRIAEQWAEKLGLGDFLSAYPHTLSGGMRQRVAIARAMALDSSILLMDEPFAALDAQLRQIIQDDLLALWESDSRTVVFITHSLEEAIILGDRVIVMSNRPGRIIADRRVPFGRPRNSNIRGSEEFGAFREELWELLKSEVRGTST